MVMFGDPGSKVRSYNHCKFVFINSIVPNIFFSLELHYS